MTYGRWTLEWWLSRIGTVVAILGTIFFFVCIGLAFMTGLIVIVENAR